MDTLQMEEQEDPERLQMTGPVTGKKGGGLGIAGRRGSPARRLLELGKVLRERSWRGDEQKSGKEIEERIVGGQDYAEKERLGIMLPIGASDAVSRKKREKGGEEISMRLKRHPYNDAGVAPPTERKKRFQ